MYDKIQHHSLDSFRYSAIFSNASEIMSGEFGAAKLLFDYYGSFDIVRKIFPALFQNMFFAAGPASPGKISLESN